ncbi:MAG: hypothetical protein ACO3PV_11535 [Pseudohongiellaceae bacterium]|jgi:hypothetical protein
MPNTKPIGVAYEDQELDGAIVGKSGGTVGFYGKTPVTQRAAAIQAASVVSVSSYISVASNLAAWAAEVNATLTGLGLWKGGA